MKNILLLCGGSSNERDVSIASGRAIAGSLSTKKYSLTIADVDNMLDTSFYHSFEDFDKNASFLVDTLLSVRSMGYHIAYIALHGSHGEDGHIQSVLDTVGLPYTGSSMMASSLGFNKILTHEITSNKGVLHPQYFTITKRDFFVNIHRKIMREISYPCVIKPAQSGSSVGVSLVSDKSTCEDAIKNALLHGPIALIQKYIPGRELSCAVMGNSNATECEAFPIIEITPDDATFFDYEQKYSPESGAKETCPAHISKKISDHVQEAAICVHKSLHCDGLSRSDFIYHEESNTLYFLEINTIPGQTKTSLCPQEALAAGLTFEEFIHKQIILAMQK